MTGKINIGTMMGGLYRDLDRNCEDDIEDGLEVSDIKRYEIIFDIGEHRYYCFVDALTMDEALGNFFRNHRTVTYDMVVDHMEI